MSRVPDHIRPLLRFFLLAYGISWLVWAPLWLPALGVTGLPVLPLNHALGGLGPMVAAFLCVGISKGGSGVRALLRSMIDAGSPGLVLVALFAPFLLLVVAMIFGPRPFDAMDILRNREFQSTGFIVLLLYNVLFFGFGEEAGWRGFALPRL